MEGWSGLTTGQKVAVTMGVSAGAVLLYTCYTRYRTAPDHRLDEPQVTCPQLAAELVVDQDGAVLHKLMGLSQTQASGGGDHELTGSPAQLRQAQQRLGDGAALRVELYFPARSMGRIIGQGGERIREISRSSGAQIYCERRTENRQAAPTQQVTVTGTREQVEAAKTLLQKASEEDAAVQRRATESSTFRSRRKEIIAVKKTDRRRPSEEEKDKQLPLWEAPQTMDSAEDRALEDKSPAQENMADCPSNICKFEVPSPDFSFRADEYVDVYVSATEKPEHFWIQILGSRSSQLEKLTTEMSDHYRGRKREAVPEIQVGDIVAAPFHVDEFWYRAEVLGFLKNGNVDLYYVDYGDNWETAREELHPLRCDFLSLPFQAVECSLSGVAPRGGTWSDQALDAFDTLSHCAEWKPLLAKISSFPSPGESCCFQIQLYDPSSDPMLDIGLELIRQGHAIKCQVSPTKDDEEDSLVARLMEEVTGLSAGSDSGSFSSRPEEGHLASDGSIEMIRADVFRIPECQQISISTPTSCPKSVDEVDSLDQSVSKMHISDSDHSATSSPSTAPYPENSSPSATSSDSSGAASSSSFTCTDSEGLSFVTSSLEDSSINSPRGCFYYLTDESSTSSSREVISISSDSEGDIVQTDVKLAPRDSDTLLTSSSDVIVIEDES
ncbi:tudor and KH domain-containing protein isoform X2 [Dendrobates tinctorius]|uniref:tudor and KH domain-containing protein isoform X2 n=1 Tax=Dendrobates tinctorius TaxID=92724 RepID=UPI003CCA5329